MAKVFEDYFSELQADMVSICLEYVNDAADQIYIYCSHEEGMISSDFFFRINGKVVERHKLNDAVDGTSQQSPYDTSVERQRAVMRILNEDIKQLVHLCKEYNRSAPTEIKMVYDVKTHKFAAEYRYDLIHTNGPVKTADDIAMEWFTVIQTSKSR